MRKEKSAVLSQAAKNLEKCAKSGAFHVVKVDRVVADAG